MGPPRPPGKGRRNLQGESRDLPASTGDSKAVLENARTEPYKRGRQCRIVSAQSWPCLVSSPCCSSMCWPGARRGRSSLRCRALVRGGLALLIAAADRRLHVLRAAAPRTLREDRGSALRAAAGTGCEPSGVCAAGRPSSSRPLRGPSSQRRGDGAPLDGAPFGAPRLPAPTPLARSPAIAPNLLGAEPAPHRAAAHRCPRPPCRRHPSAPRLRPTARPSARGRQRRRRRCRAAGGRCTRSRRPARHARRRRG